MSSIMRKMQQNMSNTILIGVDLKLQVRKTNFFVAKKSFRTKFEGSTVFHLVSKLVTEGCSFYISLQADLSADRTKKEN